MRKLLPVLLVAIALCGIGATTYTITQLTANTNPTSGTLIEVYDPLAAPKSGKYLLTNKANATFAGITNAMGIFTGDTSKAVSGAGTLVTLPTDTTANWTASGTTNSTLSGNSLQNAVVATNGITAGSSVIINGTNATSLKVNTTYTDGSNYERLGINTAAGSITLAAESAGTGSAAIDINLTPKGTGEVKSAIFTASSFLKTLYLNVQDAGEIYWNTRSSLKSPSDGVVSLNNNGKTGFTGLRLGPDVATPSAVYIRPGDGSGSDKTGGALTISGGISTGTGRGGALITQTANSVTNSSSSANTLSTRSYASAKYVDLTESSATLFANVTVGTNNYAGGSIIATVFASDGTDFQSLTSRISFDAVNKAGTVTPTISSVDNTTAASSGTLTATYTAVANANGVDLKCNAVSSLTQTTLRVKWVMDAINSNDAATVTPQ